MSRYGHVAQLRKALEIKALLKKHFDKYKFIHDQEVRTDNVRLIFIMCKNVYKMYITSNVYFSHVHRRLRNLFFF